MCSHDDVVSSWEHIFLSLYYASPLPNSHERVLKIYFFIIQKPLRSKRKLWRFLACRSGDKPLNKFSKVPAGFGQYWRSCPHSLVLRVKTKYSRREGGWPAVTMGTRNVCPLWYCFVTGGFGLNLLMSLSFGVDSLRNIFTFLNKAFHYFSFIIFKWIHLVDVFKDSICPSPLILIITLIILKIRPKPSGQQMAFVELQYTNPSLQLHSFVFILVDQLAQD